MDIGVVIPTYQNPTQLARALDSVLRQTLNPTEIVVVDDCSEELYRSELRRIIDCRRKTFEHIKLVQLSENIGPGGARNAGIASLSTEWVALLDSDDSWHPSKLEVQSRFISQHTDVTLLGCLSERWTGRLKTNDAFKGSIPSFSYGIYDFLFKNRLQTRTALFKKSLGITFNSKKYTEDYLAWLEYLLINEKIHIINLPLAITHQDEYSLGYSGNLWSHELRELRALNQILRKKFSLSVRYFFLGWSFLKFLRRVILKYVF